MKITISAEKQKQLERCAWQVKFYDERRHSKDIPVSQRYLAEQYYHVYSKLYNDMCEQLAKGDK